VTVIVSPVDHIIHCSIEKSSHISELFLVRKGVGSPKWLQLAFSFGHSQITMVFTPLKEDGTKFTVNVIQGMGKMRIAQDVA